MMSVRYEIWQLPVSHPNKFMHYDWIKKEVDILDYVLVYCGTMFDSGEDIDILETIFQNHNLNTIPNYHASSPSVSDLFCIVRDNIRSWFYVDGIGFKRIEVQ